MKSLRLILSLPVLIIAFASSLRADQIITEANDTASVFANVAWSRKIDFLPVDVGRPYIWSVSPVTGSPVGKYSAKGTQYDSFAFTPATDDAGKLLTFELTVTDSRNQQFGELFSVQVAKEVPPIIQIEKRNNSFQGMNEKVSVSKTCGSLRSGSFNLKFAYNGIALRFISFEVSDTLSRLGWTFSAGDPREERFGPLNFPITTLQIIGSTQQPQSPGLPDGVLFQLRFNISNNATLECQNLPIDFAWSNCADNTFASDELDTLYSCLQIIGNDVRGERIISGRGTDPDCYRNGGLSVDGPCRDRCRSLFENTDVPSIIFKHGWVDLACDGWTDASGDLNLNDIAYEVADLDLMSRWLAYGDSVLDKNPMYREAQAASSDVNKDGVRRSIADVVYLARVIVGDALPYSKLSSFSQIAFYDQSHDTVFVKAADVIGGVLIAVTADETVQFENLSPMDMMIGRDSSQVTLLFGPSVPNLAASIPRGHSPLFRIKGKAEIKGMEISDYQGSLMVPRRK
jgi:hypothetical protein